ncbi:hypothetical protein LXL04_027224 [Taraxacum kok-saghyz]
MAMLASESRDSTRFHSVSGEYTAILLDSSRFPANTQRFHSYLRRFQSVSGVYKAIPLDSTRFQSVSGEYTAIPLDSTRFQSVSEEYTAIPVDSGDSTAILRRFYGGSDGSSVIGRSPTETKATMHQIVHKFVKVNGVQLHLAEIGSESSPVVVFLHGFPEIWYSWRHQMIAVANAGYRAIAPDSRGYGLSDPPPVTEKFRFSDFVDDLLAILDSLGIDKIFLIAKDSGLRTAFLFTLHYPAMVAGVISLGAPHWPLRPASYLTEMPEGFYINRWREPGRAEADFGRFDARTVVRNIYILFSRSEIPIADENQEIMEIVGPPAPLPAWFTEEDLSVYGDLYEKSGVLNPLTITYRTINEGYGIGDLVIKNPMLLILGEKDYFLKFPGVNDFVKSRNVKDFATDLEIEYVVEGSHFVQEQFPDHLNQLILAFLRKHNSS